jgi:hypothetical protein
VSYLNEEALADALLASIQATGATADRASVLAQLKPHVAQARASLDLMSAGGKKKCRTWFTLVCGTGNPHLFLHAGPIDSGPDKPRPIGSGGSTCIKVGECMFCLHWECEHTVAPA